jgi:hypothetical protein
MSSSDFQTPRALFTETVRSERPTQRLEVNAGNQLSEVFVVDGSFNLVARGQNEVVADLPQGSYLVKYRLGDKVFDEWVELDRDRTVSPSVPLVPQSAAPLGMGSDWTDEQRDAARSLYEGSSLAVIIRDPDPKRTAPITDDVILSTIDGAPVARLATKTFYNTNWRLQTEGRVVGIAGNPPPGCYVLRVKTPQVGTFEMAVWVAPYYQTRVFLTRKPIGSGGVRRLAPHFETASIQVVRPDLDEGTLTHFEQLTEMVRATLASERPILPYDEIVYAVEEKGESPMLGLLGAHLLRLYIDKCPANEREVGISRAEDLFGRVLSNLDRLLPGWPDVGALTGGSAAYDAPPMLWHSWSRLAPGADEGRIPKGSYSARIACALTSVRPWLVWDVNRMLAEVCEAPVDLDRLRSAKRRLMNQEPTTSLGHLVQQTPLEDFNNVEQLSDAWGMPQSSLGPTLASMDEMNESGA